MPTTDKVRRAAGEQRYHQVSGGSCAKRFCHRYKEEEGEQKIAHPLLLCFKV